MTNPNQKPVAKSLHTITVIQQVALHLMTSNENHRDNFELAVDSALHILGLNDRPDPYGLAALALKYLKAGR